MIMHTIFEGVANQHLHCLLPYLIEMYFTLEQLNAIQLDTLKWT